MKCFPFFLLIILSHIILSTKNENENMPFNQTEEKQINNKEFKPSSDPNNSHYISGRQIYVLNDNTFDIILQDGKYFKWLVILYSELCNHCAHARGEIRKIFPKYMNSTTIRFAEIEINRNQMIDMRFDYVQGVPYIFLLQNNSLYEMDLYPNEKNLLNFIEIDLKNVSNELKPFPPKLKIYKVVWYTLRNSFLGVIEGINELP